jgi:hypothetical protein
VANVVVQKGVCVQWHWSVYSGTGLCTVALVCVQWLWSVYSGTGLCAMAPVCVQWHPSVYSGTGLCTVALVCVQWHRSVYSGTGWLADWKCQEFSGKHKKFTGMSPAEFELLINLASPKL